MIWFACSMRFVLKDNRISRYRSLLTFKAPFPQNLKPFEQRRGKIGSAEAKQVFFDQSSTRFWVLRLCFSVRRRGFVRRASHATSRTGCARSLQRNRCLPIVLTLLKVPTETIPKLDPRLKCTPTMWRRHHQSQSIQQRLRRKRSHVTSRISL